MVYNNSNKKTRRDDWATPWYFFKILDAIFHFTLDPCASDENHKCDNYFTKEQNGLMQNWYGFNDLEEKTVFVNPPYNAKLAWILKAIEQLQAAEKNNFPLTIVFLFPDSTDLPVFHDNIFHSKYTDQIWFTEGRINFIDPVKGRNSNQTGSMVVIMRSYNDHEYIKFGTLKHKHLRE